MLLLSFSQADLLDEYLGLANHSQLHHNRKHEGRHDIPLPLHSYQDILSILVYQKDLILRQKHPCQRYSPQILQAQFQFHFH